MKRMKGRNFTDKEIELFMDLLETRNYIHIIENKKTDALHVKQKNEAWQKITEEFNSCTATDPRTEVQLRTFYDNYKRRKRKDVDEKAEVYRTDGGTFKRKFDSNGERFMGLMREQFKADMNVYDSASSDYDSRQDQHPNFKTENVSHVEIGGNEDNQSNISTFPNMGHDLVQRNETQITEIANLAQVTIAEKSPKVQNSIRERKVTASDVYDALQKLTESERNIKHEEKEHSKLKVEYEKLKLERVREENEQAKQLFLLQKQKLENEIRLQEIEIETKTLQLEFQRKKCENI